MPTRFKALPTNGLELRAMIEKLKDKEARLEADLAIREHPRLEDGIMTLVLAMSDVRKLDGQIKITDRPSRDTTRERDRLEKLITFYEGKIATCRSQLESVSDGSDAKFISLRKDRAEASARLQDHMNEWADAFGDVDVDICKLIPSLHDLLPRGG